MSENQARVSVRILEKEYHITCPTRSAPICSIPPNS